MAEEISPSDLWLKITTLPRAFRNVELPQKDPATGESIGEISIVVLTQAEIMAADASAEETAKKMLKDAPKASEANLGYTSLYNNAAAVEILFRACRRKENIALPFFPTPQAIRGKLTNDEVGVLMNHYLTTQLELGPIEASMSGEEVDAWIERLGEGGSRFPLDLLSSEALRTLAFTTACRLHALQKANSSPGSPQENGPPESANPPNEDLTPEPAPAA